MTDSVSRSQVSVPAPLLLALALYFIASLTHFVHNAEYLHEYPNLPEWLSRGGVYLAWCAVTAIGVMGLLIYRLAAKRVGLACIVAYAALGFGGFDHYVVAPMSAHTAMMNATILFEAATAGVLLIVTVRLFGSRRHVKI